MLVDGGKPMDIKSGTLLVVNIVRWVVVGLWRCFALLEFADDSIAVDKRKRLMRKKAASCRPLGLPATAFNSTTLAMSGRDCLVS